MKQQVKYSKTAILITVLTFCVLVGVNIWLLDELKETAAAYAFSGVIVLCFVMAAFNAPVSIELTGCDLIIKFVMRTKIIPRASIVSAKAFNPHAGSTFRLFGSGGFFGWWGLFSSSKIGRFHACYGDPCRSILLKLRTGKKIVISCADPDALLSAL